jgi:hypothetical protein
MNTFINELSTNTLQLAKRHGDKPLQFYSETQMNSTNETFINECNGPLLALIDKICTMSKDKRTEYGIYSKNKPTIMQKEKCYSNIFVAILEYINTLKFKHHVMIAIHQHIRNINASAEVADIFARAVSGSWSGNNQIHNFQVYMHLYTCIYIHIYIYVYINEFDHEIVTSL